MTRVDVLDEQLSQAFDRAHDAPQWALPAWPDPLTRVRRTAARRRAGRVAAATAAVAFVAAGAVIGVQSMSSTDARVHYRLGSGGTGSAPDRTGAQWLLTPQDFGQYAAAHPSPSPAPDLVPSPAPSDTELAQLHTDIAAVLPANVDTVRSDAADGGTRGHATVWLRLADGTPVAVERYRLDYPLELSGPERFTDPSVWADGTAYTVLTGNTLGYGFGPDTQWSGPIVWTTTADGWFTMWTAPVATDTLLGWARGADASFSGAG